MSKIPKLTRWRDAWREPPTIPGPYLVDAAGPEEWLYRKWDGRHWHWGGWNSDKAMEYTVRIPTGHSRFRWRGLAKEPKR